MPNPHKLPLPGFFLRTIDKVKRVDKEGMLYSLDYKVNYYFLEKFVNMLATPACSTFLVKNQNNEHVFGRNYDFVHFKYNDRKKNELTELNVMVHVKNIFAKYESLAMCDGFWLDFAKGRYIAGCLDDGETDISALALIPFLCMDGMNEKGLAVSIMHLPTENEWHECDYVDPETLDAEGKRIAVIMDKKGEIPARLNYNVKPASLAINTADKKTRKVNKNFSVFQKIKGRKTMFHPVLMRRMLDYCKNVDEAIKLAARTNVRSPLPTEDYHIMISDKSGRSVIIEWVDNLMKVVETNHGTNYYLTREDHYGYGDDRDVIVKETLEKHNGIMKDKEIEKLLEDISQDYRNKKFAGYTLWTSIYNLDKLTLKVFQALDYKKSYEFKLGGKNNE